MKNKRLIDLDALLASSKEHPLVVSRNDDPFDVVERQGRKFLELVQSQHIVDAVPVVRCKDCRFIIDRADGTHGCYRHFVDDCNHDDFCSYGERK